MIVSAIYFQLLTMLHCAFCRNYIFIICTVLQCAQSYNFIRICIKFPSIESLIFIVFENIYWNNLDEDGLCYWSCWMIKICALILMPKICQRIINFDKLFKIQQYRYYYAERIFSPLIFLNTVLVIIFSYIE